MIVGIGVDVVHVERLLRWQDIPGLLERYFHPDELCTALARGGSANLSLAARFAAKEAFGKALGTGLAGIVLKDIMVENHHNGRPEIRVFNTALKALKKSGATKVHVSLTHERDNAIAMVVLEAESLATASAAISTEAEVEASTEVSAKAAAKGEGGKA